MLLWSYLGDKGIVIRDKCALDPTPSALNPTKSALISTKSALISTPSALVCNEVSVKIAAKALRFLHVGPRLKSILAFSRRRDHRRNLREGYAFLQECAKILQECAKFSASRAKFLASRAKFSASRAKFESHLAHLRRRKKIREAPLAPPKLSYALPPSGYSLYLRGRVEGSWVFRT